MCMCCMQDPRELPAVTYTDASLPAVGDRLYSFNSILVGGDGCAMVCFYFLYYTGS